jgi:hypothetical protein
MGSATASTRSTILFVDQHEMVRLLHQQHAMSDRFIVHLLARTIRIEEDLVDQLFSSSEKRLARKLLLLAQFGEHDKLERAVPAISQETLAEMVGTTRSREFLLKKQRLGFIDYKDGLKVNNSLPRSSYTIKARPAAQTQIATARHRSRRHGRRYARKAMSLEHSSA